MQSLSIKGRAQEALQAAQALSIKGVAEEHAPPDIPSGSPIPSSTSEAPSDRDRERERKKLVRHTDSARSGALKDGGRAEEETSSTGVVEESSVPRETGSRRRIQIKRPGPRSEANRSELQDLDGQQVEVESGRTASEDAGRELQPSSLSPETHHRRYSSRNGARRSEDRAWAAEGKSRSSSPAKRPSRRERSPDERREREREKDRDRSPERYHVREGRRDRDKSSERHRERVGDRDRDRHRDRDKQGRRRSPGHESRGEGKRERDKEERGHHRRDSDHRRGSLKEESKRNRHSASRSHRHRSSSPSDSEDSEEERRRRKRRKEKERKLEDDERDERRRSRKEKERRDDDKDRDKKKKPSASAASGSYGKYGVITVTDVPRMNMEFRAWLVEQQRLDPDVISRDKFNKEFAIFVDDFNNVTLPHEKYYNMAHHQARMAAIRNGEAVPKVLEYDPRADEKAHVARLRATHLPDQADLTREEIIELRRLEKERIEVSKRRQLGLEVPKGLGVRTVEVPLESWKDPNLF